jgi:hypothetical protein
MATFPLLGAHCRAPLGGFPKGPPFRADCAARGKWFLSPGDCFVRATNCFAGETIEKQGGHAGACGWRPVEPCISLIAKGF